MKTARGRCPLCNSAQFAITFDAENHPVNVRCFYNRCAPRAILAVLRGTALDRLKLSASGAAQQDPAKNRASALRIWNSSREIRDTLADRYLRKIRSITINPPASLRYHPTVFHHRNDNGDPVYFPCLVACAEDNAGHFSGIHRTWLDPTTPDFKLTLDPQKAALGASGGSIVRLTPYLSNEVVLVEGIEDGLSLIQATNLTAAVWVSLGTRGLTSVRLPESVHTVILAGDNDLAGRRAIDAAARRFHDECRQVRIIYPPLRFKDWNDALRGAA